MNWLQIVGSLLIIIGCAEILTIQMKAKYSITAERQRVLLVYICTRPSHGCFDYGVLGAFLGDCERFPPCLITRLVSNCLVEEVRCF